MKLINDNLTVEMSNYRNALKTVCDVQVYCRISQLIHGLNRQVFVRLCLPVPRLRGRLGQVRCRKASWGCFGGTMADENTKVQLVESDIPGAELPKPAEFCTVVILKRWLSCRGAKVSGNRKDLIKRLDYEPCNVNYFETIVTFAIEVNSLQTAVESFSGQ